MSRLGLWARVMALSALSGIAACGLVACDPRDSREGAHAMAWAQPPADPPADSLLERGDAARPAGARAAGARAAGARGVDAQLVFPSRYESAREFPGSLAKADRATWRSRVPEAGVITIPSSADGADQRALFYDSGSEEPKPLLVVLHSWSANFLQNAHIPYARFAVANDWVFLHPDFRGRNRRPDATLSELAVQDVIDAIDHARAQANVDDSRIYLLGYSAGAMMALVLAGQYPDRWAGVAAWVAVYDLVDWYEHDRRRGGRYARDIERSCGGVPRPGTRAHRECLRRSPSTYVERAAGSTPVLLFHGLRDYLAPPGHAIDAFNALAHAGDRIDEEQRAHFLTEREVPPALRAERTTPFTSFDEVGTPVVFQRSSQGATLVLFDGAHDMLYRPGLRWLAARRRGQPVDDGEPLRVSWAPRGDTRRG